MIVVPGYGLAVAQAQHAVRELAELLESRGVDVKYAIHPVAGRMPGHMNVLLAEANVPYPQLKEMDDINPEFERADVALVIGANDVTNPAARRPGSPVSGMPILDVDHAKSIVVIKRSMGKGYAGIDNELYTNPKTGMLFADAKDGLAVADRRRSRPCRRAGARVGRTAPGPRRGPMQKILNDPERFVDEMLDGILAAHPSQLRRVGPRGIVRADAPVAGKVAIVTGGGSGHLPVFMGYVGRGPARRRRDRRGLRLAERRPDARGDRGRLGGRGVLYLYGNYGGDVMNFDLAAELADASGIEVRTVLAADDVASAPPERADRRRGIAGIFLLYKVAGAAADRGASLDEVVAVTTARRRRAADDGRRPVAVHDPGGRRADVRAARRPDGDRDGHPRRAGRPARRRSSRPTGSPTSWSTRSSPIASTAGRIARRGARERPRGDAEGGALHPLSAGRATARGHGSSRVHRVWVGEYATSLEMAGASVSVMAVDDELAALLDAPGLDAVRRPGGMTAGPVARPTSLRGGRRRPRRRPRRCSTGSTAWPATATWG